MNRVVGLHDGHVYVPDRTGLHCDYANQLKEVLHKIITNFVLQIMPLCFQCRTTQSYNFKYNYRTIIQHDTHSIPEGSLADYTDFLVSVHFPDVGVAVGVVTSSCCHGDRQKKMNELCLRCLVQVELQKVTRATRVCVSIL